MACYLGSTLGVVLRATTCGGHSNQERPLAVGRRSELCLHDPCSEWGPCEAEFYPVNGCMLSKQFNDSAGQHVLLLNPHRPAC